MEFLFVNVFLAPSELESKALERELEYNKALKKAGLFPELSSTLIMRDSMGTITREVTGSLDAAHAVTGHKDIKMVHYQQVRVESSQSCRLWLTRVVSHYRFSW